LDKTITQSGENTLLKVKVKPDSESFEVIGKNKWRNHIEIKLTSKPRQGKANKELKKRLEKILDSNIRIKKGKKSREKTLVIQNSLKEKIQEKLKIKTENNGLK